VEVRTVNDQADTILDSRDEMTDSMDESRRTVSVEVVHEADLMTNS
jgi:hypothetical protein